LDLPLHTLISQETKTKDINFTKHPALQNIQLSLIILRIDRETRYWRRPKGEEMHIFIKRTGSALLLPFGCEMSNVLQDVNSDIEVREI